MIKKSSFQFILSIFLLFPLESQAQMEEGTESESAKSVTVLMEPTLQDTLQEMQRQIEILTEEIEKLKLGEVAEPEYRVQYGLGPAGSKIYRKEKGVSLAGYGEVVYQNFGDEKEDGSRAGKTNNFDFLRNVVYVGFKYSDKILFNSEIEFEHGTTEIAGEVSVEFAYLDLLLNQGINFRAGMLLTPVGIVNERHEPSTFHGVLRPDVERNIIPTTWRANGAGVFGNLTPNFSYRLYLVESLNADEFKASDGVRSGRMQGSRALAEDLALTGRLDYEGIIGGNFGVSFFTGETGQNRADGSGKEIDGRVTLFDVHGDYMYKELELRGLYARMIIDNVKRINEFNELIGAKSLGKTLSGWYFSAAYDVLSHLIQEGTSHYLAPFIRIEWLNTQDEVPDGFEADPANDQTILTFGVTYKPHPNVAFKLDYQNRSNEADTGVDQFNAAINYLY